MMNTPISHEALRMVDVATLRDTIRTGRYQGHTAGLAAGFLQVNLVILPERYARDFLRFCQRNPKPCPLVGVTDAGVRRFHTLGHDLRADTDAPGYNVYENGELARQCDNVAALWRDDFVAFALGCSFTFEHALMNAGIAMRHVDENKTVPMFRTNLPLIAAGPFAGTMVVSMRPVRKRDLSEVAEISARFPLAHGGPVNTGTPSAIGIKDVEKPDWGDAVDIRDEEVPVFWACGVTPQNVAIAARLPLFISHRPGAMLITDVNERADPPILDRRRAT
ncbi:MAG: putative hydro-lyase [Pseudomonadota bacterium]